MSRIMVMSRKVKFPSLVAALGDIDDGRLPGGGGLKFLLAVEEDLDRLAGLVGQQDGDVLIGIGVQLAAEAAADAGLNDPDPGVV